MIGGNFNETVGKYVLDCAIKNQENMHDSCYLVGGMEGSGKSDLILECINYLDNKRGYETPISNVAYNLGDFFMSLKTSKPLDAVSLDEGKELMAMNYGDKKLKDAINIFTVIRKKRLISFIAFTNPTKVTQYFREDRIRGVFLLKKRKKNYSIIYYYTKTQFLNILAQLRLQRSLNIQSIFKHKPLFVCVKKGAYEGRLRTDYEDKKDENIEEQLDLLVDKYKKKDKVEKYNVPDTMRALGIGSTATFYKFVPLDFIESKKNVMGKVEFTKDDVNKIKEMLDNYTKNRKYNPISNKNGINAPNESVSNHNKEVNQKIENISNPTEIVRKSRGRPRKVIEI